MWEKLYTIAWFALAVGALVVLPIFLADKTRSLNHRYRGKRRG